jgi:hypothetical protein
MITLSGNGGVLESWQLSLALIELCRHIRELAQQPSVFLLQIMLRSIPSGEL